MSRLSLISACTICGIAALVISARRAETGAADAIVRLQASAPGTQQIGHAHLSGLIKAGQFVGGGAGLANVNADLLDGLNSTAFLQSVPVPLQLIGSDSSSIFSAENTSTASQSAAIRGTASGNSGVLWGGHFESASSAGRGVGGVATATSGTTYGGYFESTSPSGRGVGGFATATSGTTYGGYFESTSPNGRGVYATSEGTYGIQAFSKVNAGIAYGGNFSCESSDGMGVFATSAGPYGIQGISTLTAGTSYGGFFNSQSTAGIGMYGLAMATTGMTTGAYGKSNSSSGRGVFGWGSAVGATDTPYGVRGQASTGTNGFAVYADGDMGASGVKPFRIDHPDDPANKYLLHYSTESPFPQNFYNGNAITDGNGYAWVELPEYFGEINTNFKYVLTIVDDDDSDGFVQAKISKKIKGNRFQIRTSAPNVEVSWRVDADRNDLRVRTHRPTDVRDKTGPEKGKYQNPEYYGLPTSMGLDYEAASVGASKSRPKES